MVSDASISGLLFRISFKSWGLVFLEVVCGSPANETLLKVGALQGPSDPEFMWGFCDLASPIISPVVIPYVTPLQGV